MKNRNYNLLKLLHGALDGLWRIERHYLKDVRGAKCSCPKLLKDLRGQLSRQVELLRKELMAHAKKDELS